VVGINQIISGEHLLDFLVDKRGTLKDLEEDDCLSKCRTYVIHANMNSAWMDVESIGIDAVPFTVLEFDSAHDAMLHVLKLYNEAGDDYKTLFTDSLKVIVGHKLPVRAADIRTEVVLSVGSGEVRAVADEA